MWTILTPAAPKAGFQFGELYQFLFVLDVLTLNEKNDMHLQYSYAREKAGIDACAIYT